MDDDAPAGPDYTVGYGKPPEEHRFKPGRPSANPYGRKGKPENRERILTTKKARSVRDVILSVANKPRRVSTADGRSRKMSTTEVLTEKLVSYAMTGSATAALKLLELMSRQERAAAEAEPVTDTGVMVIQATPPTMEETLALVKWRDDQLRREEAQRDVSNTPSPGAEDEGGGRRISGSEPQVTSRETRAYGEEGGTTRAAPTPGRSLKADGLYRLTFRGGASASVVLSFHSTPRRAGALLRLAAATLIVRLFSAPPRGLSQCGAAHRPRDQQETTMPKRSSKTPSPEPEAPTPPPAPAKAATKLAALTALLQRPQGATLTDMMAATGWQAHSVRGALAGALKKKAGLAVTSAKADGVRTYRVEAAA